MMINVTRTNDEDDDQCYQDQCPMMKMMINVTRTNVQFLLWREMTTTAVVNTRSGITHRHHIHRYTYRVNIGYRYFLIFHHYITAG